MTPRALPALALLAATLACFGGRLPARELYRLTPRTDTGQAEAPAAAFTDPVDVPAYATDGIYANPEIVYRLGEATYGAYPHREWALPLGTMLADVTASAMRRAALTRGPVTSGEATGGPVGLVWRGAVREFEEVNRGDTVSVAVALDAILARAGEGTILWRGTHRVERPVTGDPKAMTSIVDALSAATTEAVDALIADARSAATVETARP